MESAVALRTVLAAAKDAVVGENATYVDVVIPAAGGLVQAGPYVVSFPARAVCVESAGYGPELWNAPCETTSADVPLRAAYWMEGDKVMVEFLADLRFDPAKVVTIYAVVGSGDDAEQRRDILFWTRVSDATMTVDESAVDESLETYLDPSTGALYRRIQHFSGYVVGSGRCDEENSENCEGDGGQ